MIFHGNSCKEPISLVTEVEKADTKLVIIIVNFKHLSIVKVIEILGDFGKSHDKKP